MAVLFSACCVLAQVKVTVEMDKLLGVAAPRALGIDFSPNDSHVMDKEVPALLRAAGITTVHYPGGNYADNYHWTTYKPTKWQGADPPNYGYYAPGNDFGHFVALLDQTGTTVIAVNYGSNLDGTAGGEPAEAAAWVAYANGNPSDTRPINKDSAGHDWQTVGYWATLRASRPLTTDDGLNFLRMGHPQGLNVKYWEVGNQVFGNGYYGGGGMEEDLHAPYPKDPNQNEKERKGDARLAPETYGRNVIEFSKAMKAVDPRIKIGAALDTPTGTAAGSWTEEWSKDVITGQWGSKNKYVSNSNNAVDWDKRVLKVAGPEVDFVFLRWYAGAPMPPDWKTLDEAGLLLAPQEELPKIGTALNELFHKYCGENASKIQFIVSGLGSRPGANVTSPLTQGLFAADAYVSLMEMGAANIDWLELHANYFLNDKNVQGPAYYGIQMVHLLASMNDQLVEAKSSTRLLTAHAAKRADGSLAVMLINKSPKEKSTVKLQVAGGKLAAEGFRFDWGQSSPTDKYPVTREPFTGISSSFSVVVPPYTITNIVIPALSTK